MAPTNSQKYLSTRGGSYGVCLPSVSLLRQNCCWESYFDCIYTLLIWESTQLSFEEVVIKGLAADGGLFIPEEIPTLPDNWESDWRNLSFEDLAFQILSLYISPSEIPPKDLQSIIKRSYSTFRHPDVTPLVELDEDKQLYLLELFHGRKYAIPSTKLSALSH
jgi:threonine synthase